MTKKGLMATKTAAFALIAAAVLSSSYALASIDINIDNENNVTATGGNATANQSQSQSQEQSQSQSQTQGTNGSTGGSQTSGNQQNPQNSSQTQSGNQTQSAGATGGTATVKQSSDVDVEVGKDSKKDSHKGSRNVKRLPATGSGMIATIMLAIASVIAATLGTKKLFPKTK